MIRIQRENNNQPLNNTEEGVLTSLHLRGHIGKTMGGLSQQKRMAMLNSLIDRGYLTPNMQVTQKAHNEIRPRREG